MKLAAIAALLVIGAACISAQYVTIWGDVVNTRIMAEQRVTVSSSWMQIKERTINYSSNGPLPVRGVMHLDYKTKSRVSVSLVNGGIGQNFAAVNIVSERSHGINSIVRFYG